MGQTRKTKHVTYAIGYHFVWCPKYQKSILTGDIASFAEAEIRRLCGSNGWTVGSLALQEDHVHLFLSAPPAVSPSHIANTLKGITARQIFKQFPEVKQQLWGGSFWSRSFDAGTVWAMSEDVVKKYIELGQDARKKGGQNHAQKESGRTRGETQKPDEGL